MQKYSPKKFSNLNPKSIPSPILINKNISNDEFINNFFPQTIYITQRGIARPDLVDGPDVDWCSVVGDVGEEVYDLESIGKVMDNTVSHKTIQLIYI